LSGVVLGYSGAAGVGRTSSVYTNYTHSYIQSTGARYVIENKYANRKLEKGGEVVIPCHERL